jgi:hypothetical protein
MTIGNLLSVAGVYSLTSKMQNKTYSFLLLATLQLVWILIITTTGMVSEPKVMDAREEKKINKKSFCGKIYSVLKQTLKACKQDHALAIGLIAVTISRMGTMVQTVTFSIWIKSYVCILNDPNNSPSCITGPESNSLWQTQNLLTNVCAIPIVIVTGKVCDKLSAKILIPTCIMF